MESHIYLFTTIVFINFAMENVFFSSFNQKKAVFYNFTYKPEL